MKWTISSHSALVVSGLTLPTFSACADLATSRKHGKTSEKGGLIGLIAKYMGMGYAGVV